VIDRVENPTPSMLPSSHPSLPRTRHGLEEDDAIQEHTFSGLTDLEARQSVEAKTEGLRPYATREVHYLGVVWWKRGREGGRNEQGGMRQYIHRFPEAREGLCGGVGTEEGGRMSGKR